MGIEPTMFDHESDTLNTRARAPLASTLIEQETAAIHTLFQRTVAESTTR
jgi:hypothetical protein